MAVGQGWKVAFAAITGDLWYKSKVFIQWTRHKTKVKCGCSEQG